MANTPPTVGIIMGSTSDWDTMQIARRRSIPRRRQRAPGDQRASHAPVDARMDDGRRSARAEDRHRRCRRRGSPRRRGGGADAVTRARRADGIGVAQGPGFAALDGADAGEEFPLQRLPSANPARSTPRCLPRRCWARAMRKLKSGRRLSRRSVEKSRRSEAAVRFAQGRGDSRPLVQLRSTLAVTQFAAPRAARY